MSGMEFRIKIYCMNYQKESNHSKQLNTLISGGKMIHVPSKLLVNKHSNYLGDRGKKSDKITISNLNYSFNKMKLCLPK